MSGCQGARGPEKGSGGDGAVVTPVPIPNTEVKRRSGEGTRDTGESSALPGLFFYSGPIGAFFRLCNN